MPHMRYVVAMAIDDADVTLVLAALKRGQAVQSYASGRYWERIWWADGQWHSEEFDEGVFSTCTYDDAQVRSRLMQTFPRAAFDSILGPA